MLRLSQNIAGVTLLALGNGAPDIFSALAGIGQVNASLILIIGNCLSQIVDLQPRDHLNQSQRFL